MKRVIIYCVGLFLSLSSMAVKVECKKADQLNRGTHVLISDEFGSLSITFREREVLLLRGEIKSIERIFINAACNFSEQNITCNQPALANFSLVEKTNFYDFTIQRKDKIAKNFLFQKEECKFAF